MGVITTYFVALALALKSRKSISNTAPLSIILMILVQYIFAKAGFMSYGVYVCLAITVIGLVCCVFHAIRDFKGTLAVVITPVSIAYICYTILLCYANIGRGFMDSDDLLVWGYNIKLMCRYNAISTAYFPAMNNYPSATLMWEYFANKTWIGFAEGVTLWAYNVYIMALVLPLYDFLNGKDKVAKFLIVFAITLILPFMCYDGALSRLSANILAANLLYWGLYNVYQYWIKQNLINLVGIMMSIFALTLAVRMGVLLAFGILAFACFVLTDIKDKYWWAKCIIGALILSGSYYTYKPEQCYIGIVVAILALVSGIVIAIIKKNWDRLNSKLFIELVSLAAIVFCVGFFSFIRDHEEQGGSVVYLFFKHIFTTFECSVINILPLSISTLLIGMGCFIYMFHKRFIAGKENSGDNTKMFVTGIFIMLSIMEILCSYLYAYASEIGIEPSMNRLPSFNRYMTPCLVVPILFVLYFCFQKSVEKANTHIYLIALIATVLCVDCSRPVDFFLNKYEQPEYNAFRDAGVELKEGDKVFYINIYDQSGIYKPLTFYYQIQPAISNYTRAYAGAADLEITGYEEDTASFGRQLIDLGYNYVYIQTYNQAFFDGYKGYFESEDEIKTGTAYRIEQENGKVMLIRI